MKVNVVETLIEFECPKCKVKNRTSADEFLMAIDGYASLRCVACGKFDVALIVLSDRDAEQRDEADKGRAADSIPAMNICPNCKHTLNVFDAINDECGQCGVALNLVKRQR